MSNEPAPGTTPIPVIVIETGDHTIEWWLVGSTVALTVVTALTLIAMVYEDHRLIQLVRSLLLALVPKRRNGSTVHEEV